MKTLSWPRGNPRADDTSSAKARLKLKQRILVADSDIGFARRLTDYMWERGFETRVSVSVQDAMGIIESWQPDTVFVELLLPLTHAAALFSFINSGKLKKRPKVIIMSKQTHAPNVEQLKSAGAEHFLVKPFSLEEALRFIDATQGSGGDGELPAPVELGPDHVRELHLLNLFLKQATVAGQEGETSLHNLMRMIGLKVKAIRCSFIQVLDEERGRVLASNDNGKIAGFEIQLRNYPEIREVRRTLDHVVIPNIRQAELMSDVLGSLALTPFETLVLFPVFRCGTFFGVLTLRMKQKDPIEIFYIEKFGQVCSQILTLAIGTPGQRLVAE